MPDIYTHIADGVHDVLPVPAGTAFPTNSEGKPMLFYRTDEGKLYYYNGAWTPMLQVVSNVAYSSTFRAGAVGGTTYTQIGTGTTPFRIRQNGNDVFEVEAYDGQPYLTLSDGIADDQRGQIGCFDDLDGTGLSIDASDGNDSLDLKLTGRNIYLMGSAESGSGIRFSGIRSNILPHIDLGANIGSSSYRWSLVRARTITSGDLGFEETECAICGERFSDGDILVLMLKTIDEENISLTIPVHDKCKGTPKTIEVQVPVKKKEHRLNPKTGLVEEYFVDDFEEVEEKVYYVKKEFQLDEKTGIFKRKVKSSGPLNKSGEKIEAGSLAQRDEAVESKDVKVKKQKFKNIKISI